jgi:hypothetical protein
LAEIVWIVDDGRKKIHCLDEREVIGHAKHPGVVECLSAYEETRIGLNWKRGQRAG